MHEWSLVENLIKQAVEIGKEKGLKKITRIEVKVGKLQHVDPNVFSFAFGELSRLDPMMDGAELRMEEEGIALRCCGCGNEWEVEGPILEDMDIHDDEGIEEILHFAPEVLASYLKCPRCEGSDFDVLRGRDIRIEAIEGL